MSFSSAASHLVGGLGARIRGGLLNITPAIIHHVTVTIVIVISPLRHTIGFDHVL